MDHLKLTTDKISVEKITDLVGDDSCGAISMFVGTTRDNFDGKKVLCLEYEAYEPMALKAMKNICEEIRNKWPTVHNIALYHRLGVVPIKEASVVIAVSSPHRQDSLSAVGYCIDTLKGSVPIWKKEVYDSEDAVWKENTECSSKEEVTADKSRVKQEESIDKSLVQINVSWDELQHRIQNFIERKREQVNVSNVHDFIPSTAQSDAPAGGGEQGEGGDTCARVRTTLLRRNDSKGHLKIRKVDNEWGPQTARQRVKSESGTDSAPLPAGIAERVRTIQRYLNMSPVDRDVYRRLKEMEDRIAQLDAISPEYAQFWRGGKHVSEADIKQDHSMDYTFTADDISKKIEQLEREGNM